MFLYTFSVNAFYCCSISISFSLPSLLSCDPPLPERSSLTSHTQSVLNLADSFVDNVLHAACHNAKERGSKVLEIRDLQLVLERTYNIRIPGYSSEELRTVRKIAPTPGWYTKLGIVAAAKVNAANKGEP